MFIVSLFGVDTSRYKYVHCFVIGVDISMFIVYLLGFILYHHFWDVAKYLKGLANNLSMAVTIHTNARFCNNLRTFGVNCNN